MVGSHRSFLLSITILLMPWIALCQSFDGPAQRIAQRIAGSLAQREAVTLSVRSVSSMTAADVATARAAIERELRGQGLAVRAPSSVQVAVTISENWRGYLW